MFDAINGAGGVVNQIIGDGLMAIFGAPLPLADHRRSALAAALEMIEMIGLLNHDRAASGRSPIAIGIGIASGEVIAGYTGTQQRATYTCVGRTVNLAARLEAYTKVAKRHLLVDAATRAGAPPDAAIEPLGAVVLSGMSQPIDAFSVVAGR